MDSAPKISLLLSAQAGRLYRFPRSVPGHGPVCRHEGIATIREVFDDIAAQAEKMYKAGLPVEEAQHLYVVPNRFKNLQIWSWGFTIGSSITILYSEWKTGIL